MGTILFQFPLLCVLDALTVGMEPGALHTTRVFYHCTTSLAPLFPFNEKKITTMEQSTSLGLRLVESWQEAWSSLPSTMARDSMCDTCMTALEKRRLEDQKVKVILGYLES